MKQKKVVFVCYVLTTMFFLSACGSVMAAPPTESMTAISPSVTPSGLRAEATATILPTATLTTSPLPVETITPMPRNDSIAQNCLDVPPPAPANFTTKGILLLGDYQTRDTQFLNLETGNRATIPGLQNYVLSNAVSPDRKTLAYQSGDSSSFSLILTDAMNTQKRVLFTRQAPFAQYDWLNNQELLLGKDEKWVVYNPYTGQEKSYTVDDFPNYNTYNIHNQIVFFDSQAEKVIYGNKNATISLFDLESKQFLAQVTDSVDRSPIASWTLDGSQAAVVGTTVVGEHSGDIGDDIFVISREGQMSQLTYLAKHYGLGFNIYSLSWSPDSHYIAFWMWYPGVISNNWVLGVLDTSTKKVTDYCISTDPYARGGQSYFGDVQAPLWSPDGKQIIVEHRIKDSGYVVLLDIAQNTAIQIAKNMVPLAWMTQEP